MTRKSAEKQKSQLEDKKKNVRYNGNPTEALQMIGGK